MIEIPGGRDFLGIVWYKKPDEERSFCYLPAMPLPERDPQGRPTLSLWVFGSSATLQFGVQLDVEADVLGALRREIAAFAEVTDPAAVQLSPARVAVKSVELAAGDGEGSYDVIDTRSSSGHPPFVTLFNATLDDRQKKRISSALNGRQGFALVRYSCALPVEVSAQTTMEGDVRDDIRALCEQGAGVDRAAQQDQGADRFEAAEESRIAFKKVSYSFRSVTETKREVRRTDSDRETGEAGGGLPDSIDLSNRRTISLEDCQARIELALQEDRLRLTRASDSGATESLKSKVDDEAKAKAAQVLMQMAVGSEQAAHEQGQLRAAATRTEKMSIPLKRSCDIASWFPSGTGTDHIRVVNDPLGGPT